MKPIRTRRGLDWFAFAYLVVAALVMIANIVIHVIGPW